MFTINFWRSKNWDGLGLLLTLPTLQNTSALFRAGFKSITEVFAKLSRPRGAIITKR